MRLHGPLHDGQPKPKAPGFPRAAPIDAVEAIEYARCVLGSDSRALIAHRDRHRMRTLEAELADLQKGKAFIVPGRSAGDLVTFSSGNRRSH
jgi:hypothetical protein